MREPIDLMATRFERNRDVEGALEQLIVLRDETSAACATTPTSIREPTYITLGKEMEGAFIAGSNDTSYEMVCRRAGRLRG